MTARWLLVLGLIVANGCGDDADDSSSGNGGDGGSSGASGDGDGDGDGDTFEAQVERGEELFGEYCAECHGAMGQGTANAPAVVGDDALPLDPPASRMVRDTQFRTALDVYEFASENMPGDDPGSLEMDEYLDVLAFDLFANGVELDEPLTAANADDVVINP